MAHGKCSPDLRAEGETGLLAGAAGEPREIDSGALFGDEARIVAIRHGSELYTLRITRADKLILTK